MFLKKITTIGLFCTTSLYMNAIEKPNIIIIYADDMGYNDVSYNNQTSGISTPGIDKMAKNGIVFTDAHSPAALSIPSRYGLLTGRYAFRPRPQLGNGNWGHGFLSPLIEPQRETIGSLLQRAGYTTACIGKWHLGLTWSGKDSSKPLMDNKDYTSTNIDFTAYVHDSPNERGFDYSFILPASLDMPPYVFVKNGWVVDPQVVTSSSIYPKTIPNAIGKEKSAAKNDINWGRGIFWRDGEMSKSLKMEDCFNTIVGEGLSFINRSALTEKPFMLYLAITGPHTPWLTNPEFKNKSKVGRYGDFVLQVDDAVSQVNNLLKKLKIDKNTIVIVCSDNGSPWEENDIAFYHHNPSYGRGQKGDIYEGGHHMPMVVQWPEKIKKQGRYNGPINFVDFLATFSELTNEPIKKSYGEDSFSFLSVLNGNLNTLTRDHNIYISGSGVLAIKKGVWKYTDYLGSGGFTEPSKIEVQPDSIKGQLYNMKSDPWETNNLYKQHPEIVKELSTMLQTIRKQGYSAKR